jgi:hypothetical protein
VPHDLRTLKRSVAHTIRTVLGSGGVRTETINGTSKPLLGLLALYALASLVHFVHNAEFLGGYPNLPAWLSRSQIYGAWCGITAVGLVGYTLYRRDHPGIGFWLLVLYTSLGFDGLLHYRRAPVAAHTVAMNLAIWMEVVAAALALLAVVTVAARDRARHNA